MSSKTIKVVYRHLGLSDLVNNFVQSIDVAGGNGIPIPVISNITSHITIDSSIK